MLESVYNFNGKVKAFLPKYYFLAFDPDVGAALGTIGPLFIVYWPESRYIERIIEVSSAFREGNQRILRYTVSTTYEKCI